MLGRIASIFVEIAAPTSRLKSDLGTAERDVQQSAQRMNRAVGGAAGAGDGFAASLKAATFPARDVLNAIFGIVGAITRVTVLVGLLVAGFQALKVAAKAVKEALDSSAKNFSGSTISAAISVGEMKIENMRKKAELYEEGTYKRAEILREANRLDAELSVKKIREQVRGEKDYQELIKKRDAIAGSFNNTSSEAATNVARRDLERANAAIQKYEDDRVSVVRERNLIERELTEKTLREEVGKRNKNAAQENSETQKRLQNLSDERRQKIEEAESIVRNSLPAKKKAEAEAEKDIAELRRSSLTSILDEESTIYAAAIEARKKIRDKEIADIEKQELESLQRRRQRVIQAAEQTRQSILSIFGQDGPESYGIQRLEGALIDIQSQISTIAFGTQPRF